MNVPAGGEEARVRSRLPIAFSGSVVKRAILSVSALGHDAGALTVRTLRTSSYVVDGCSDGTFSLPSAAGWPPRYTVAPLSSVWATECARSFAFRRSR